MLYQNIRKEIDDKGNYIASAEDSGLRQALSKFLQCYHITFNNFGDSFINGKEIYGNHDAQFDELLHLCLWRGWIQYGKVAGKNVWLVRKDLSSQEIKNKWDTGKNNFKKDLSVSYYTFEEISLFWVKGEVTGSIALGWFFPAAERTEEIHGSTPHFNRKLREEGYTHCYFVELPNDLIR